MSYNLFKTYSGAFKRQIGVLNDMNEKNCIVESKITFLTAVKSNTFSESRTFFTLPSRSPPLTQANISTFPTIYTLTVMRKTVCLKNILRNSPERDDHLNIRITRVLAPFTAQRPKVKVPSPRKQHPKCSTCLKRHGRQISYRFPRVDRNNDKHRLEQDMYKRPGEFIRSATSEKLIRRGKCPASVLCMFCNEEACNTDRRNTMEIMCPSCGKVGGLAQFE